MLKVFYVTIQTVANRASIITNISLPALATATYFCAPLCGKACRNGGTWLDATPFNSPRDYQITTTKEHLISRFASREAVIGVIGNYYDNSPAESFFATVKLEAVQDRTYASRRAAREELFGYIEVFYNHQRLHSGIDFQCLASRVAKELLLH